MCHTCLSHMACMQFNEKLMAIAAGSGLALQSSTVQLLLDAGAEVEHRMYTRMA